MSSSVLARAISVALLIAALLAPSIVLLTGRAGDSFWHDGPERVWGEAGPDPGFFQKPRAMAIDDQDRLFIVDKSARIQVFSRDGKFSHGWRTPEKKFGKPTGLGFDRAGNLMVADTHYYRILFYTPQGELLPEKTIGGEAGTEPGQLCWVTDAVEDSEGNFYISQYGDLDCIQKYSPNREFICKWGQHGTGLDEFRRPQSLHIDEQDHLWVADACNHRIMVFDVRGSQPRLVQHWGSEGSEPGKLRYPYSLWLSGDHVFVCEFGNSRVQKFERDGTWVATWGEQGRDNGQLHNPWAIVRDSRGSLHVLDTYNQRVQRFRL